MIEEDKNLLKIYSEFSSIINSDSESNYIPWIIRFTFNKEKMMDCGLVMEDINIMFLKWAEMGNDIEKIKYIYADDNSKELVGRLTIVSNDDEQFINGISDQSDTITNMINLM